MTIARISRFIAICIISMALCHIAAAEPATQPAGVEPIQFEQEVLPNGLRVVYAPLHQAPVVHVRVMYHVGSRDERANRQGFAHMFEHMMFRGSAHVKPDQHMKLVDDVGGICNAFTSFDQTVYHDTVPASAMEMAMYLEADRMSSFKVTEDIYKIERKVVAEEWRIRQNQPYGNLYEDMLKNAFVSHSYRWTPIGNMDHLRAAPVSELQEFFNTYYLPNNAVLVLSGDFNTETARQMVQRYFAWIPRGPDVVRRSPAEPLQTEQRRASVDYRVPLPAVVVGYHLPPWRSDDQYPLQVLSSILGGGRSSRLEKLLVNNEHPLAVDVSASDMALEDGGIFAIETVLMQGKDPAAVESTVMNAVAELTKNGVTEEELVRAKAAARVEAVHNRETATSLATDLGEAALMAGDPGRANQDLAKLDAVTAADVVAAARKYLAPEKSTVLRVNPDPLGKNARAAAAHAAAVATQASMDAPVAASTTTVAPRPVEFPAGYRQTPPVPSLDLHCVFDKGTEVDVDGVKLIIMPDHRLPQVSWNLTLRTGSHQDPVGREGLASLTDSMIRRGVKGLTYEQLNNDLESRGITIEVADAGDVTKFIGSCSTEQLEHGIQRMGQILTSPTFPEDEFGRLKDQTVSGLALSQESPGYVADHEMNAALYGTSPLGVSPTPQSVSAVKLDDAKKYFAERYRGDGAVFVLSGDVTVERGQELARQLLSAWRPTSDITSGGAFATMYKFPEVPADRKIVLVDRPGARGATLRLGIRAYDIHSDDKFAGSLAGQILSAGIESRLNRYVRAEKGLSYGVHGVFMPGRHGGAFISGTDCASENAGAAIEAIVKVLNDMCGTDVTPDELATAKTRVAGSMVMQMQTIQQQAGFRVDGLLNGYPVDYYDTYPQKVAAVSAEQVRSVMDKYVKDGRLAIVVVAPAEATQSQLEKLGNVTVLPMPGHRGGATQPTTPELLRPATKP